ncbi:unnamed protein product [Adineta ricciae]|uniref:Uncharacterized protein n=1 Tax=Adineta ricciae TaxID=249248 RepID=A0A815G0K2_ADIRI|nr:unnamed protein product [Adineta ricciae]
MVKFRFSKNSSNDVPTSTLNNLINIVPSLETIHQNRKRLITKDGNINIEKLRVENRILYFRDIFTSLLDLKWRFILILFSFSFVISWLIFAVIWYIIMYIHNDFSINSSNETSNEHIPCISGVKTFSGALLYSIETQQTIGYGTRAINEQCTGGIILLIIQSIFSLIIQSLWVGLIYTKLSRPKRRRKTFIWSRNAVISLRDGILTFQCRLGDMRSRSTLIEAHIRMYFITKRTTSENEIIPLTLLDMNIGYDEGKDRFFLNWPIIIEHKIDSKSPLYEMNKVNLSEQKFEILLILEGTIEPTGMMTQIRTSYMPNEIIWAGRFSRMIRFEKDHYVVDYSKFNSIQYDHLTKEYSAKEIEQRN